MKPIPLHASKAKTLPRSNGSDSPITACLRASRKVFLRSNETSRLERQDPVSVSFDVSSFSPSWRILLRSPESSLAWSSAPSGTEGDATPAVSPAVGVAPPAEGPPGAAVDIAVGGWSLWLLAASRAPQPAPSLSVSFCRSCLSINYKFSPKSRLHLLHLLHRSLDPLLVSFRTHIFN
ncbi:unnamed protein product [Ectocarpus sp. 8 AP-2014]